MPFIKFWPVATGQSSLPATAIFSVRGFHNWVSRSSTTPALAATAKPPSETGADGTMSTGWRHSAEIDGVEDSEAAVLNSRLREVDASAASSPRFTSERYKARVSSEG
ncbi:MAG: hypothetical protein ACLPGW_16005 [Roseiarcus sp.]